VTGIFRSHRECRWAGVRGQRFGSWDDFDCHLVGGGYRGRWDGSWGPRWDRSWAGDRGWSYRRTWVLTVVD
jgi:hypothetical protein